MLREHNILPLDCKVPERCRGPRPVGYVISESSSLQTGQ